MEIYDWESEYCTVKKGSIFVERAKKTTDFFCCLNV
ncbi:unnamed protein product [Brassica oleracea var. botrytis]|uniref:(rape) hypothetical protein n=1 Tax=Brassica napus TaxID=3708 RepID=A0A816J6Y9_BRANA|nr:unnamed protein product [Brassica napus]